MTPVRFTGLGFALAAMLTGCTASNAAAPDPTMADAVTANARALYAHYDANQDGHLDRTEAAALSLAAADFDALDANHDSVLAWSEFGAPGRLVSLATSFARVGEDLVAAEDDNRDGRLSYDEYRLGMLVPWPGPTVTTPLADPLAGSFQAADSNNDGFLSEQEAPKLVSYLLRTGYHLQQRSH